MPARPPLIRAGSSSHGVALGWIYDLAGSTGSCSPAIACSTRWGRPVVDAIAQRFRQVDAIDLKPERLETLKAVARAWTWERRGPLRLVEEFALSDATSTPRSATV